MEWVAAWTMNAAAPWNSSPTWPTTSCCASTKIESSKNPPKSTGPMVIQPMTTDGTARAISGAVTTQGDSLRCSLAW